MSALAPSLQAFFTDRLVNQLNASPNTIAAYRDSWRLLLGFLQQRTGRQPSQLDLADLHSEAISAFLDYLEHDRRNSIRTRNARLAAIRSFFRFASLRHPEHAELIARVLAIPTKHAAHAEISYLTGEEITALIDAPDMGTWIGRRDHALIDLAAQTGLRVSELTGLRNCDIELPAALLARMLGINISVAVAWQRASAGDWTTYAADYSRRADHHQHNNSPELPDRPNNTPT